MPNIELLAPNRSDKALEQLFLQLASTEGQAEIIDGEIVQMSPTQPWPSDVAAEIFVSLRAYARATRKGRAVTDNAIFRVNLPRRQSFYPDAAFHIGASKPMQYYEGAPVFAVEVRSAGDYGAYAEQKIAEKRAEYFEAGTQVIWDVDLRSRDVVRVNRASSPDTPTTYRQGDIAEAEPAVPGWTVPVNEILPEDWLPPTT